MKQNSQTTSVTDRTGLDGQNRMEKMADQAGQQITTQLSTGKQRVASELDQIADAFRETGRQLQDRDQATIGQYADQLATGVERVSHYFHDRNMEELKRETEALARRQPAMFLGGAFLLGLMAARFLKSSAPTYRSSSVGYSTSYGIGASRTAGTTGSDGTASIHRTGGSYGGQGTSIPIVPVEDRPTPPVVAATDEGRRPGHGAG